MIIAGALLVLAAGAGWLAGWLVSWLGEERAWDYLRRGRWATGDGRTDEAAVGEEKCVRRG